jgi:transposase
MLCRKRLTRNALMPFMGQLPPVLIGIEAGGGAYYWAKRFREHGHDVKLLASQFVKPFVKSNKNNMCHAEAIAEAVTRPTMCISSRCAFRKYPASACRLASFPRSVSRT